MESESEREIMNDDVTRYIDQGLPWQVDVCGKLREVVHQAIPGVEEEMQYGKPHFLRNGQHAAVIHVARGKVTLMVFNAADIAPVKGVSRSLGNGDRKAFDVSEDQHVDHALLADVLARTSSTL
jgi:hypothetical protein